MSVYPEGPEGVVQIENYEFGQRFAVAEGCRLLHFGGGERDCRCGVRGGEGGSGLAARHSCCAQIGEEGEEGEGCAVEFEWNRRRRGGCSLIGPLQLICSRFERTVLIAQQ